MSERMESPEWYAVIKPGMPVFDSNGVVVGRVEDVHQGYDPPGVPRPEADADEDLFEALKETFDPVEELDEDMRKRLYQAGFIRVDGPNLLGSDRYIDTDTISEVSDEGVHLNVERDTLRSNL